MQRLGFALARRGGATMRSVVSSSASASSGQAAFPLMACTSWSGGQGSWDTQGGIPPTSAMGARSFSLWGSSSSSDKPAEATTLEAEPAMAEASASAPPPAEGVQLDDIVSAASAAESGALQQALEECWLPTQGMQHLVLAVKDSLGLPWWAALVATTVGLRLVTLPVNIIQTRRGSRMQEAKPHMESVVAQFKASYAAGDPNAMAEHQRRISAIWKKYDIHPGKMLLPMVFQMPIFLGMFGALRAFATAKVPSLVVGGTLWCTDLSSADPTYLLPILTCASFMAMLELGASDGMEAQTEDQRKKFKLFMRFIGLAILPFTASMPAALHIYWTASNVIGTVQSVVLKTGPVRRALNLPILPNRVVSQSADRILSPIKPVTYATPRNRVRKQ